MSFYVNNPTESIITIYSSDGTDSVDIYPDTTVPVDDKFRDRLPKAIQDRSVVTDYSRVFYRRTDVGVTHYLVLGLV